MATPIIPYQYVGPTAVITRQYLHTRSGTLDLTFFQIVPNLATEHPSRLSPPDAPNDTPHKNLLSKSSLIHPLRYRTN